MVLADIYDLLNDLFFQSLRFIIIAAVAGVAIFIGIKLRKRHDAKKAAEDVTAEEVSDTTNTTM